MPPQWNPTGQWMAKFRQALVATFNSASIEMLTSDYFGPTYAFSKLTSENGMFEFRIFELIEQARLNDLLLDLVAAARERRPKNKELANIAEDLGLTMTGPRLLNPTGKPLEELIQANARFITPALFRERLAQLEGQVCWIDIPGSGGTGFLVGPDLVVTNHHVIERVKTNQTSWRDVTCRFDYRQAADGSDLTTKKKVEVKRHSENWLVHSNPPSQFDWDPTLGDAAIDETDCALIRLAERIGEIPVGGDTLDTEAPLRQWISANSAVSSLTAGNQVFLLQHPKGEPLQLAVGTVKQFNARGTRVRYDANSKDGSSGSPCFDADLNLVALHHSHDPAYPPQWNQAIPFSWIQKVWREKQISLT
jgi:hypothetical protein